MSGYLAHLQSQAHAADLTAQAADARTTRRAGGRREPPNRLRHTLAVLLVALATRLDHALAPPVPATTSGTEH